MERVPCAICGSSDSVIVVTTRSFVHPVEGKELFSVCRCTQCGLLYTNPRPTESEIAAYYQNYSLHSPANREVISQGHESKKCVKPKWLRSLADNRGTVLPNLPPGSMVLEIGCATGTFMKSLEGRGWILKGVEPSQTAAEYARRSLNLDVITGTVESAAFPSNSFDLVYGWHVVEHLAYPVRTLSEVQRILKPGGFLCLSMPNAGAWERKVFGRYWAGYELPFHYYHYTPTTITMLLEKVGFSVVALYHQRNIAYLFQSVGAFLEEHSMSKSLAKYFLTSAYQGMLSLLTYPIAVGLAAIGQGGRITVVAKSAPLK